MNSVFSFNKSKKYLFFIFGWLLASVQKILILPEKITALPESGGAAPPQSPIVCL